MEVSQQQLDEWRELMRRVYVSMREVREALATHNREKATLILETLEGEAVHAVASLDRAGAQTTSFPGFILSDRPHDTPTNRQYLSALWRVVPTVEAVDGERPEDGVMASDVVRLLIDNASREIYGPPVDLASLFGEEEK